MARMLCLLMLVAGQAAGQEPEIPAASCRSPGRGPGSRPALQAAAGAARHDARQRRPALLPGVLAGVVRRDPPRSKTAGQAGRGTDKPARRGEGAPRRHRLGPNEQCSRRWTGLLAGRTATGN